MNDTSYLGIEFTQAEKDRLTADLNGIRYLQNLIIEYDRQISVHEGNVNHYENEYNNRCPLIDNYKDRKACSELAIANRNQSYADRASVIQAKNLIISSSLPAAQKKYADDLTDIQNRVKIQIQQNQAAQANENQDASNLVTLNQNDPAVLQAQINASVASNKLKTEKTIKIVGFVLIAAVVVAVGWFLIRRVV